MNHAMHSKGGIDPVDTSIVGGGRKNIGEVKRRPRQVRGKSSSKELRDHELCVAFVDLVGFSAKMHADEDGTIRKWADLRETVLLPLLDQFGGTFIKSTGDGILATFPNARDGALWSQASQKQAREHRQGLAMRIALNFCRVVEDGSDIAGDGVNIAARLQEHAAAGGVIATERISRALGDAPGIELRPIGQIRLRKLGAPIDAYELVTDGRPAAIEIAHEAQIPSIAVLPFRNLKGTRADDYFGAGLVEDIIVSLSSLRQLTVISRSSTIAFAQQSVDPLDVGNVLGVRYVLDGAVRRSGRKLRVRVHIWDAETKEMVFGDQREFTDADTFKIQDEIVEFTVSRIVPNVNAAERRRALRKRPGSFTAYDLCLRALDLIGSLEQEKFDRAYEYLTQANIQDPSFAMPLAWMARWHGLRIGQGWSSNREADAVQAAERAQQAIRLDSQNALALATFGHVQSYLYGDFDTAIGFLDRAREASPSSSVACLFSSVTLSSLGRNDEAMAMAERALRLSPFDENLYTYYAFLGIVHYDAGDFETAIKWLSRSIVENPRYTTCLRTLAVSMVAAGRTEEARAVVSRHNELEPDFRLTHYRKAHRLYKDPERAELFRDRLRVAGVPE